MVVLFATLGFTSQAVTPTLAWAKDLRKVVVFHSKHKKSVEAMEELRKQCKAINVEFEPHRVDDEYSLVPLVKEMERVAREHNKENIIFNITGGTKMLSSAALLLCVLHSIDAVYTRETNGQILEVPLLKMIYEDLLNKKEKNILRIVADNCNNESRTCELSEIYGILKGRMNPSVIAYHLNKLEGMGLIERKEGKNKKSRDVVLKESALLLME
jgi:CRISPR locus-related DNA-binding protein